MEAIKYSMYPPYRTKQEREQLVSTEAPKFVQQLEQILDFKKWGFKQTFVGFANSSLWSVIYDSEWCRVRFTWDIPDPRENPVSHVSYGRLHASSNEDIILWNGEKCYCWHEIRLALYFLDNVSPQDTQDAMEKRFRLPPAEENFRQETRDKGRGWTQPEWMARMHLTFWEQYDQELFELFDLRRPDLWEKYSHFLKEYYRISNLPYMSYRPRWYKVC